MGHKIKAFAKFLMFCGILACTVFIFLGLRKYGDNHVYMNYRYVQALVDPNDAAKWAYGESQAYEGMYTAIGGGTGIIICIVSMLPIYWLGCLFEKVEALQTAMQEMKHMEEQHFKQITSQKNLTVQGGMVCRIKKHATG